MYLIIGIIFNLSLLGFFKYTDFFLENFNFFTQILHLDFTIPLPHILLPLALSFVTFQQIAFLVDCYKRIDTSDIAESHTYTQKNQTLTTHKNQSKSLSIDFLDYCLFITFFPQLIAGPIVHHKEMMPQFQSLAKSISINYEYIAKGLFIFSIGLFKKVCIADSFGIWANAGFKAVESGSVLNFFESWASALSYTFQLYFDFSGYCDMAIGLGLFFGIVLPINFNSPYKASNIADFWRRWHITLGRFLKDYVYIPLGGNRYSKFITLRNLFIVAFISGNWHGAGWGFVIWGILHGLAMCTHRAYRFLLEAFNLTNTRFLQSKIYKLLAWILTFNFINLTWIFFRSENLSGALNLIKGMCGGEIVLPRFIESKIAKLDVLLHTHFANYIHFDRWASAIQTSSYIVIPAIIGGFVVVWVRNSCELTQSLKPKIHWLILSLALFCLALGVLSYHDSSEFLYFNF